MWLVMPMIVIIASTAASAPIWIGIKNTNAGIATAPVIASNGWKDIAAHAVGGRL